jgi:hypothetical protein
MPGNWLFLGPPGGLYQFGLRQYSNIYIYMYTYYHILRYTITIIMYIDRYTYIVFIHQDQKLPLWIQ